MSSTSNTKTINSNSSANQKKFTNRQEFENFLKNLANYPNLIRLNFRGLTINNAPPQEQDIELLARTLENNRNIRIVDLKDVELPTESLIHLEEMLHKNKTITALNFETTNTSERALHPDSPVFNTPTDLNTYYGNKIYDPKTGDPVPVSNAETGEETLEEKTVIDEVIETLKTLRSRMIDQNKSLTQYEITVLQSNPPYNGLPQITDLANLSNTLKKDPGLQREAQLKMIDTLIKTHEHNWLQLQRLISIEVISQRVKENQKLKARADAMKQRERDTTGVGQRHQAALQEAQLQALNKQKEREKAAQKEKRERPYKMRAAQKQKAIEELERVINPRKQRSGSESEPTPKPSKKRRHTR